MSINALLKLLTWFLLAALLKPVWKVEGGDDAEQHNKKGRLKQGQNTKLIFFQQLGRCSLNFYHWLIIQSVIIIQKWLIPSVILLLKIHCSTFRRCQKKNSSFADAFWCVENVEKTHKGRDFVVSLCQKSPWWGENAAAPYFSAGYAVNLRLLSKILMEAEMTPRKLLNVFLWLAG